MKNNKPTKDKIIENILSAIVILFGFVGVIICLCFNYEVEIKVNNNNKK